MINEKLKITKIRTLRLKNNLKRQKNRFNTDTAGVRYGVPAVGDSNSQWDKFFLKVPVGGSASLGKCQLRD